MSGSDGGNRAELLQLDRQGHEREASDIPCENQAPININRKDSLAIIITQLLRKPETGELLLRVFMAKGDAVFWCCPRTGQRRCSVPTEPTADVLGCCGVYRSGGLLLLWITIKHSYHLGLQEDTQISTEPIQALPWRSTSTPLRGLTALTRLQPSASNTKVNTHGRHRRDTTSLSISLLHRG